MSCRCGPNRPGRVTGPSLVVNSYCLVISTMGRVRRFVLSASRCLVNSFSAASSSRRADSHVMLLTTGGVLMYSPTNEAFWDRQRTLKSMDVYADAAGLVERSAAAYASGVPGRPADDGFFGPASVTWRTTGDLSSPVGGLRALLMQALHPLAMAGVDQHSDWREDPVGRLAATSRYLATVGFGGKAAAEKAAARGRRIHERVTGTDPVTGLAYAASDPALLLWVHAALVDSTLVARELFGTQPKDGEADAFVREMVVAA